MKLLDIVKVVGTGIFSQLVPGGPQIISAVNKYLPEDKKLDDYATGEDIKNAVSALPPSERVELFKKEYDVNITQIKESHSTVRSMLEADSKSTHTTRPYIAKQAFHVLAAVDLIVISLWAYGVGIGDVKMVGEIMDGSGFVLSINATFGTLLWAYFGILKQEHKNKLDAINGAANPAGIAGIIGSILKK